MTNSQIRALMKKHNCGRKKAIEIGTKVKFVTSEIEFHIVTGKDLREATIWHRKAANAWAERSKRYSISDNSTSQFVMTDKFLNAGNGLFAKHNGEIVGYLESLKGDMFNTVRGKHTQRNVIVWVYIEPKYRGAGLATALYKFAMTELACDGMDLSFEDIQEKYEYWRELGFKWFDAGGRNILASSMRKQEPYVICTNKTLKTGRQSV